MLGYQNRYLAMFYQPLHFLKSNFVVGTISGAAAPRILAIFWVFWANIGHLAMDRYQNRYFATFYQCSHFLKVNFVIENILGAGAPRIMDLFGFLGKSRSFDYALVPK